MILAAYGKLFIIPKKNIQINELIIDKEKLLPQQQTWAAKIGEYIKTNFYESNKDCRHNHNVSKQLLRHESPLYKILKTTFKYNINNKITTNEAKLPLNLTNQTRRLGPTIFHMDCLNVTLILGLKLSLIFVIILTIATCPKEGKTTS